MNRVLFASNSEHWRTPSDLYASLDAEFHFDFDPCPIGATDGLTQDWTGRRVYCNPPYGPKVRDFLQKHIGTTVAVFLLPARTDTKWFHEIVMPNAKEIRFLKGRLHFNGSGPAPFPSMIVIFVPSEKNVPRGGGER